MLYPHDPLGVELQWLARTNGCEHRRRDHQLMEITSPSAIRQMRVQLAASMPYRTNRTEPSARTELKPPLWEEPKRTDQKVGWVESGCLSSGSGTASPKRT